jgi:hypothetical protein
MGFFGTRIPNLPFFSRASFPFLFVGNHQTVWVALLKRKIAFGPISLTRMSQFPPGTQKKRRDWRAFFVEN